MTFRAALTACSTLALVLSCGTGQQAYLDRVRPQPEELAHPSFLELRSLVEKPKGRNLDDLARTWKEFLGDEPLPLRTDAQTTFVYYDFSHQLTSVFLEVSFAPGRLEPMVRVGASGLYVRVYAVPHPEKVRYRFSDGTRPLIDPFHADILPGDDLWQQAAEAPAQEIISQWVPGITDAGLAGQDVRVTLPPGYRQDLAQQYPLMIVVGLDGADWGRPLAQLMEQRAIRPIIAVSVGSQRDSPWVASSLKPVLEEHVLPWVRHRYRASMLPSDLYLVGWGDSARAVQEVASLRSDIWTRTWFPPATDAKGEDAWNSQAQAWLRSQFTVAKP